MKSYCATLSHGAIYLVPHVALTFESVDEILKGEKNKPLQGYFLSSNGCVNLYYKNKKG